MTPTMDIPWVHRTWMRCLSWFHSVLPRPPQQWDAQNADPCLEQGTPNKWLEHSDCWITKWWIPVLFWCFCSKLETQNLEGKVLVNPTFLKVVLVCLQKTKPCWDLYDPKRAPTYSWNMPQASPNPQMIREFLHNYYYRLGVFQGL